MGLKWMLLGFEKTKTNMAVEKLIDLSLSEEWLLKHLNTTKEEMDKKGSTNVLQKKILQT